MDVNKEIGTAAGFAQVVWIACGLYLYLTTPGATLFSGSAGLFIIGGMFASALVFGVGFHGLQRGIAQRLTVPAEGPHARAARRTSLLAWALPIAEAILIFVAADWAFQRLETARVGVPVEYASDRQNFEASLKLFSDANKLEEQARPEREAGRVNPETEAHLIAVMESGLERARTVGDVFLGFLDPELPERYKTQLVRGYEMLVEGRKTGDLAMQTAGNSLVGQFYQDFLPKRADAILEKLGVKAQ